MPAGVAPKIHTHFSSLSSKFPADRQKEYFSFHSSLNGPASERSWPWPKRAQETCLPRIRYDPIRSGVAFPPRGHCFPPRSLPIHFFLSFFFFCFLGQRDIDELKNDCRRECRRADFSAFGLLARLCYSIEK